MKKHYKVVNGTHYNEQTSDKVIDILESIRINKNRVVLDYGDTKTGKSWDEVYDVTGTISRSNGIIKIPIIIHNKRSIGGPSILDFCIIGIKESKGGRELYSFKP